MAEKLFSCFRRRRTNRSSFKRFRRRRTNRSNFKVNTKSANFNVYPHDPKEKVFEATKSADAVLLNEVLQEMDCTERIALLAVDENSEHTPLISAVRNGNLDCVKVLLKLSMEQTSKVKHTLLIVAKEGFVIFVLNVAHPCLLRLPMDISMF